MPQSRKSKRVDGLGKLTKAEKDERDARAQYWMNQRKIERVAEAAARHGWTTIRAADLEDLMEDGTSYVDEDEALVVVMPAGFGSVRRHYRVERYEPLPDHYVARCVETEVVGA